MAAFRLSEALSLRTRRLPALILLLLSGLQLHAAPQQDASASAASSSPSADLLTLDSAVKIALGDNRSIKIAQLEIEYAQQAVAVTKTHYYPATSLYVFGSQPLNPISFDFPEGAFGTYAAPVGPIPAANTHISFGDQFTTYIIGRVSQPLTQIYKVGLGVDLQSLTVSMDRERLREQRQSVVKDVKQSYGDILKNQAALDAIQQAITFDKELDRVVGNYLAEQKVLESESLQVKAQLAKEEADQIKLQDALDTQKENMNNLLGRDIRTQFRVEELPSPTAVETSLTDAQNRALQQRPEVREAQITVDQSKVQRRLTKSQYIPDIGLTFQYISPFNVAVVPQNIATVGLEMNWTPVDWGERRHELAEDDIRIKQASTELTSTQQRVLIDVNSRYRTLLETRSSLAAAQASQAAETEKLRESMDQYKQQTVQLKDVMRVQADLAKDNASYQEALSGFWTAKADFEKALGEDQ